MIPSRLGAIVVKQYATGDERGELAEVLSSCDAPSFNLRSSDGSDYHWRQDLTRDATPDEITGYWRQRAESAEHINAKLTELNSKLMDSNSNLVGQLLKAQRDRHIEREKHMASADLPDEHP